MDWVWNQDEIDVVRDSKKNTIVIQSGKKLELMQVLHDFLEDGATCKFYLEQFLKCNWQKNEINPDLESLNTFVNALQTKWRDENWNENWCLLKNCFEHLSQNELSKVNQFLHSKVCRQ